MNTCPFCQRVDREECETALVDERTRIPTVMRFEPLNPVTPGHMLFLPRVHAVNAAHMPYITGDVFRAAATWGQQQGRDFNLITSAGTAATQTVDHLHVHYVPRRLDDGLHLPWTGQQK